MTPIATTGATAGSRSEASVKGTQVPVGPKDPEGLRPVATAEERKPKIARASATEHDSLNQQLSGLACPPDLCCTRDVLSLIIYSL